MTTPGYPLLTTYLVKTGDTFEGVSQLFYGSTDKVQAIKDCNDNLPTLIAGNTIAIPDLFPTAMPVNPTGPLPQLVQGVVANLEGRKLLQLPVLMLIGMTTDAATTLSAALNIHSIFDLATAPLFNAARVLVSPETPLEVEYTKNGFFPGELLAVDPRDVHLEDLKGSDITNLHFEKPEYALALKNALKIVSVRDLALWPPFRSARTILTTTFAPPEATPPLPDPEAPADLVPSTGNFPTERVYYTSVFMDVDSAAAPDGSASELSGPLDLSAASMQGFTQPATGGILTLRQSWYAKGVTLGQLLHSLALAPGESTRIAVIDWSRLTTARTAETVSQVEALSEVTGQSRAISEATSAVAREMQTGSTAASMMSNTTSGGVSVGMFGWGGSVSSSTSGSLATNVSRSTGERDISAETSQRILASTQQSATSSRNKRAAIVTETSEKENATATTRMITNYNHMHALSVQYYEVVQAYRVVTETVKAERVLFIPMKVLNFHDRAVINRYRGILQAVAMDSQIGVLIQNWTGGFSSSPYSNQFAPYIHTDAEGFIIEKQPIPNSPRLDRIEFACPEIPLKTVHLLKNGVEVYSFNAPPSAPNHCTVDITGVPLDSFDEITFDLTPQDYTPRTLPDPSDANALVDQLPVVFINYWFRDMANSLNPRTQNVTLRQQDWKLEPDQNNGGEQAPVPSKTISLLKLQTDLDKDYYTVIDHLNDNALYYSQCVWANTDPLTFGQMLAGYQYQGKCISGQIDPRPVAMTGNYLGFRWPGGESADWQAQYVRGDNSTAFESDISLPSSGVFAEAVLGRFNAAEKLDITRFWNWQDSPIPLVAPDISALNLDSRAQNVAQTPGSLEPTAATIHQAAALPDPTGLSGVLSALTAANMFRDMSGQAATIGLAQQGSQTTAAGATSAAEQAGKNMETYMKNATEMAKTVLPIVAGGMGGATISKAGALLNGAGQKYASGDGAPAEGEAAPAPADGAPAADGAAPAKPSLWKQAFGALLGR